MGPLQSFSVSLPDFPFRILQMYPSPPSSPPPLFLHFHLTLFYSAAKQQEDQGEMVCQTGRIGRIGRMGPE